MPKLVIERFRVRVGDYRTSGPSDVVVIVQYRASNFAYLQRVAVEL